ncbi:protein kinase [Amycolatopsis sp. NPDC059021]|uniref:serine/threonine-protein kinase n=1 Tax=Amycolatopsis sp. NPDC059021 TaxID=3346704 RepID=UPI003671618A
MAVADEQDADSTVAKFALDPFEPPPPALFAERYALGKQLGEGATAKVYRAQDWLLDRTVAVKLFHPGTVAVSTYRRSQEVQALSAMRHPGLVSLYDAGVSDGRAYLAMRFVDGPNLAERLRGGPLPPPMLTQLGADLADALAHVHAHGVTHRDLKPANILLADDRPLIADFGVARLIDATRVTEPGAVVGTAAYLAPEQVLGERPQPPVDVYALGLVLLECLTGEREYPGTPAEAAITRLHRRPRIPDGLPKALAGTLRAMTAAHPEERPTAADVALALREGRDLDPPRRHHYLRFLAVAAPTALVLAGLVSLLGSPTTPADRPAVPPRSPAAATPTSGNAAPTVTVTPTPGATDPAGRTATEAAPTPAPPTVTVTSQVPVTVQAPPKAPPAQTIPGTDGNGNGNGNGNGRGNGKGNHAEED